MKERDKRGKGEAKKKVNGETTLARSSPMKEGGGTAPFAKNGE